MFAIRRSKRRWEIQFRLAYLRPLAALLLAALASPAFAAPPVKETAGQATAGAPIKPSAHDSSKSLSMPEEVPPVRHWKGFEVIPGKDPNDWSFTLEPYGWAMGMAGDIGVRGLPPTHVDFSARTLLQHLDWGIFAKGEIRKGRWGILADGFYAELSASGDPPGPLYDSVDVTLRQGLASLALAYRIISDRRGFVDIYAGAR
jgi:hypothetical protein